MSHVAGVAVHNLLAKSASQRRIVRFHEHCGGWIDIVRPSQRREFWSLEAIELEADLTSEVSRLDGLAIGH